MPLHVSNTRAHRQEVKIVLYSLWYHRTYRCDDTRGCIVQFWPPDDEHLCSKHVEARNKLIIKFSASSWLTLRQKKSRLKCEVQRINILFGAIFHRQTVNIISVQNSNTNKINLILFINQCKAEM